MTAQPKRYYTPEEYLALESVAEYKSEYLDGEIFAMAGASEAHNTITLNIGGELRAQLRNRPCRVYASDMRVHITPTSLYTYPDVVAVCGPREFADAHHVTLLNPTVIFEVLSPSTEAYDRGKKFVQYRRLESLREYLLVAQDEVRVEHWTRQSNGWLLNDTYDLNSGIYLPAVDATLSLAAVYENVEFPTLTVVEAPG